MKSPHQKEGQGFLEYFLLVVIFILLVLIISKLFGPAVTNFIQNFLESV